jgi:Concanavalin A-like lectin/glucanases superfamily
MLPAPPATDDDGGTTDGDGEEPAPGTGDDPDSEGTPDGGEDEDNGSVSLPAANQTAVSQDGVNASAFRLGYRNDIDVDKAADNKPDPAWCFTIKNADNTAAADVTACTTQYVAPGEWVHLTGIADPLRNQMKLYVNGTPALDGVLATVPGKLTWESTGKFAIGRSGLPASPKERWIGGIDEVWAVPRVFTEDEIDQRAHEDDGLAAARTQQ